LCLTYLICSPQEQLPPIVGHEITLYGPTRILSKMVSTRNRARVNKQAEAGPTTPANSTPDLAPNLDSQAMIEQELADLKKRSANEIEALRRENSCLRRKIEVDPTQKGKAKETSDVVGSPAFQPTEEASTILPRTPSPPLNKLPSSQPIIHTSIPPFQETLWLLLSPPPCPSPTSHPITCLPPYPPPTSHPTTCLPPSLPPISPLTTSLQLFPPSFTIPSPLSYSHPHNLDAVILLPISLPTPPPCSVGTFNTGMLHR